MEAESHRAEQQGTLFALSTSESAAHQLMLSLFCANLIRAPGQVFFNQQSGHAADVLCCLTVSDLPWEQL